MLLYASGGILFANSGKKYAKNAAKTKVLDSFAVDKQVFSKTVAKYRIVSAPTPLPLISEIQELMRLSPLCFSGSR